jgi:hypothetical protein
MKALISYELSIIDISKEGTINAASQNKTIPSTLSTILIFTFASNS